MVVWQAQTGLAVGETHPGECACHTMLSLYALPSLLLPLLCTAAAGTEQARSLHASRPSTCCKIYVKSRLLCWTWSAMHGRWGRGGVTNAYYMTLDTDLHAWVQKPESIKLRLQLTGPLNCSATSPSFAWRRQTDDGGGGNDFTEPVFLLPYWAKLTCISCKTAPQMQPGERTPSTSTSDPMPAPLVLTSCSYCAASTLMMIKQMMTFSSHTLFTVKLVMLVAFVAFTVTPHPIKFSHMNFLHIHLWTRNVIWLFCLE